MTTAWGFGLLAVAQVTPAVVEKAWDWPLLGWHVFQVFLYVLIGLGSFALAYLIIAKVTPFSIRKELEEDHNTAMAIVLAAVFLGISIIVAASIRG